MSIKTKLLLSTFLTLVLSLIIAFSGWYANRIMLKTIATSRAFEQESMYLQMLFRGINESLLTEGTQDSIKLAKNGLAGFENTHKSLMSETLNADIEHTLSQKIDPQWRDIKDGVAQFFRSNDVSTDDNNELMTEYGRLITLGELLTREIKSLADRSQALAESTGKKTRYTLLFVVIVILTMMFLLFSNLINSIIKPINILKDATLSIAQGNLSTKIQIKTEDEIGQLADSFNKMGKNLNETTVSRDELIEQIEKRKEV